jgi:hypothetical protein
MIEESLARLRAHRNNIHRYRRLLTTQLSELERAYLERDRCCRKSPKIRSGQFLAERQNKRRSPFDGPSARLPKSPVSSSPDNESPQIIF